METKNKTKKLCSFTTHAVCVAPILENFNYGICECPPRCNFLDTHHEAVQYGQYFSPNDWRKMTKETPMVLASMMLYLDRVTEVDEEVAEYSQARFIDTLTISYNGTIIRKKEPALQRHRRSSGFNVRNVLCHLRRNN